MTVFLFSPRHELKYTVSFLSVTTNFSQDLKWADIASSSREEEEEEKT
jgi:hypothetical protein